MQNKSRYFPLWIVASLAFLAAPATAAPRDELDQTRKEIEQSQAKQSELAEEAQALESELRTLREKLVKSAAAVQRKRSEAELSAAESQLRILDGQIKEQEAALAERRVKLAGLIKAALALSRTPPEAVVMMPGDPLDAMKAARALKMTSDSIKLETERIGKQMADLQELKGKMAKRRDALALRKEALDKQKKALVAEMAQRRTLQEKLGRQQRGRSPENRAAG